MYKKSVECLVQGPSVRVKMFAEKNTKLNFKKFHSECEKIGTWKFHAAKKVPGTPDRVLCDFKVPQT